jgi:RimJ/RimL family protein N-acetyltransferase
VTGSSVQPEVPTIWTERLELVSMSVPFMQALERRDMAAASAAIAAAVPEWLAEQLDGFVKYRLGQLDKDPSLQSWLGRALILPGDGEGRRVIGSIGFHGPPDEAGRLEIGYSVDPGYRRQGYAREAVLAMFDWAHAKHGIGTFIASISPENEPSLRLARQFGFTQIGEQMDEIDGLELVLATSWPRRE